MPPKPFFSGRIPQDLYNRIESHIAETQKSKTDVLISALSAYLNFPPPLETTKDGLLDSRLIRLEEKVNVLDKLVEDVTELRHLVLKKAANHDTQLDNKFDNEQSLNNQLSILEPDTFDNTNDNKSDNPIIEQPTTEQTGIEPEKEELSEPEAPKECAATDVRELILEEILELPEVQDLNLESLKTRLRNARYQNRLPISAGRLMVDDARRKEGRKPLWKVWHSQDT